MSDLVSRSYLLAEYDRQHQGPPGGARKIIEEAPSAEPEITYCKDCRKHNQGINEAPYLADRCPLILHRGYAHGHEYDYQFCVYAERKGDNE